MSALEQVPSYRVSSTRLELLPLSAPVLRALIANRIEKASALTGFRFVAPWPDDPAFFDGLRVHLAALERDARELPWRIWAGVERETHEAIGSTGFKGPPDRTGSVELGWTINRPHRRHGYASEAAGAMIVWALRQPGVSRVIATIATGNRASEGVARRVGMRPTNEIRHGLPVWMVEA